MTVATSAAVLRTAEGAPVPLQTVAVRAALRDLLAEVEVVQTYRNDEAVPIEAVYSFPLPVEAVLLEVSVQLGERTLSGRVVARKQAE
jgi:Ca-activated chloride channel family protein